MTFIFNNKIRKTTKEYLITIWELLKYLEHPEVFSHFEDVKRPKEQRKDAEFWKSTIGKYFDVIFKKNICNNKKNQKILRKNSKVLWIKTSTLINFIVQKKPMVNAGKIKWTIKLLFR